MTWFRKKPQPRPLPTAPVNYPPGICVRTSEGTYRIGNDNKRYRIVSDRILQTWNFPFVVETSEVALSGHPRAVRKLGFRDGSLLNNLADGRIYLVSGGRLRHVTSPSVLDKLGLAKEDAVLVSDAEIKIMEQGDTLD